MSYADPTKIPRPAEVTELRVPPVRTPDEAALVPEGAKKLYLVGGREAAGGSVWIGDCREGTIIAVLKAGQWYLAELTELVMTGSDNNNYYDRADSPPLITVRYSDNSTEFLNRAGGWSAAEAIRSVTSHEEAVWNTRRGITNGSNGSLDGARLPTVEP